VKLLTRDPAERLGSKKDSEQILEHEAFNLINKDG
jgi:hypothetical protein